MVISQEKLIYLQSYNLFITEIKTILVGKIFPLFVTFVIIISS